MLVLCFASSLDACAHMCDSVVFVFFKQKTAYELRISDWSSDVCSSDLAALRGTRARVHHAPFGDIWLRDTGPIFVRGEGGLTAVDFGFNGWGGKYDLPNDDTVAASIARLTHTPLRSSDWILDRKSTRLNSSH